MILRKDIQLVAYLFQKRIEFYPLVKTVYVDDSLLSEEMKFRLGEYETEPEPIRRMPYKKKEPKPKVEKVKKIKPKKNKVVPIKKPTKFQVMLRKKPEFDLDKVLKVAKETHQLPKDYQRPKGEYSNPQWQDYYKD